MSGCETFTVCKIEAGRAILMSQEDYELIEFPSKLLPKNTKTVSIKIESKGEDNLNGKNETETLLKKIKEQFGVNGRAIERFKEEIESENFLKLSKLGSTAAIINWQRSFLEIFGKPVKIDTSIININCTCSLENKINSCYCEEYVDYVRKTLKYPINGINNCRINLPIDLRVSLLAKTSIGYFKSNEIILKSQKFDDLSGIFLLIDDLDGEKVKMITEMGGNVRRSFDPNDPITAVIVESFDSELFRIGIENNLPTISSSWIDALLSNKETTELPSFEDHLVKERKG